VSARERFARYVARKDDAQLERRFGSPPVQRALLAAMARGFDPAAAEGFAGSIEYVLLRPATGRKSRRWTVLVFGDKGRVTRNPAADPDLTVKIRLADFIRVGAGQLDATEPLLSGRASFEGDFRLASRLPEMFAL
jgi:putative sterol carrier protein